MTPLGLTIILLIIIIILLNAILLISWRAIHQLNQAVEKFKQDPTSNPVSSQSFLPPLRALADNLNIVRQQTQHTINEISSTNIWLETLFESIDDGIVTYNTRNMVTSFNKGAETISGLGREAVFEKDIDQVFKLAAEPGKFTDRLPAVGSSRRLKVRNQADEIVDMIVTRAELRLPERKTTQTALVMRDITAAAAAQNLRTYFLANISHEFRTPLSALNASVELLLEEIEALTPAEISQLLGSVHLSVTGLQTLIDNLLESSSIEAGKFRIRRRKTDFGTIIQEAHRVMLPLLQRRRQSLAISAPKSFQTLKIDPTRQTQVVVNLLSNASKYSPIDGQIDLEITLQESDLRLTVADRGRGVSSLDEKTLFKRFTRSDDQDDPQYGIGLGLYVVKNIVEEHGGQVGVMPRPEGGSIFWFTIPREGSTR